MVYLQGRLWCAILKMMSKERKKEFHREALLLINRFDKKILETPTSELRELLTEGRIALEFLLAEIDEAMKELENAS